MRAIRHAIAELHGARESEYTSRTREKEARQAFYAISGEEILRVEVPLRRTSRNPFPDVEEIQEDGAVAVVKDEQSEALLCSLQLLQPNTRSRRRRLQRQGPHGECLHGTVP